MLADVINTFMCLCVEKLWSLSQPSQGSYSSWNKKSRTVIMIFQAPKLTACNT